MVSLAYLETVVYLSATSLPINRYFVAIDIPDDAWVQREYISISALPIEWDAIPHAYTSVQFGAAWLRVAKSAILVVPSAIIPDDKVILVNPVHPASSSITAKIIRRWQYDGRIFKT